jgi:hypothetical protein
VVVAGVRVDGVVEVGGICLVGLGGDRTTVSLESLNLNDLRLGFLPVGNIRRLDAIDVRGEVLGVKKRSSRSESSEGSRSSNSL